MSNKGQCHSWGVKIVFLTQFYSPGAVAGVFAGLGVLLVSLCAVTYLGWIHRRRRNTKHIRKPSIDSTVVDFKTHLDPPYPYLGSEPPKISSKRSSASSHPISLAGISEWWTRRRGGRRSSQFRDVFDHRSRSPSFEVKHLGEEDTQWTLGKVLEDQQHQVITPLAPVSRAPKRSPLVQAFSTPGDRQSRGSPRKFTLEDALFPSLPSPPVPFETTRSASGGGGGGRHPYAQV